MTDGTEQNKGSAHATPAELQRRFGDDWPASLRTLLDRQLAAAGELDALSRRQHELIDGDDPARLLTLLGERRGVVDRLTELMTLFEPFAAVWDGVLAATPEAERAELVRRVDAVASLVDSINQRDMTDHAAIGTRRDALASKLAGLRTGRSAVGAYGGPVGSAPRFQDREA